MGIRLLAPVTFAFSDVSQVAVHCVRILSVEVYFRFLQEVMLENLSFGLG